MSLTKQQASKQANGDNEMSTTYKLSTKTFGKTARKEAAQILGSNFKFKKVGRSTFKLVDDNHKMIAHAENAAWNEQHAALTVI